MWGQSPFGHGRSLLSGIAGAISGTCLKHLGAELCSACSGVMLSAEKQCCLVLMCLQGRRLGSLEGPAVKDARASLECTVLLPSMLWGWQPGPVAQGMHKTQKCQLLQGYTHLKCFV